MYHVFLLPYDFLLIGVDLHVITTVTYGLASNVIILSKAF